MSLAPQTLAEKYALHCQWPSDIVAHLPRFVDLVSETDAKHVIELGTRTGVSTIAWLYALEGKGKLTSVDIDPKPEIGDYDHWTFIQGDDLDMGWLESAEIVFIDTSHHYDHTVKELEMYRHLATKRIVCHDTRLRRPEGSPTRPLFPVRTAILEFVERHGFDWIEYEDCWGLGVINVER